MLQRETHWRAIAGGLPGDPDDHLLQGDPMGPVIFCLEMQPGLTYFRQEIEGEGGEPIAYVNILSLGLIGFRATRVELSPSSGASYVQPRQELWRANQTMQLILCLVDHNNQAYKTYHIHSHHHVEVLQAAVVCWAVQVKRLRNQSRTQTKPRRTLPPPATAG